MKLGSSNLELQDLWSIDSTNIDLQVIHCMKSIQSANKSEFLFLGGNKHILVLKLTKSIYLQYFYKLPNVMDGPIIDIKLPNLYLVACGQSNKPLYVMKLSESFTIKQDKIDFSSFDKPTTTELGPMSRVI